MKSTCSIVYLLLLSCSCVAQLSSNSQRILFVGNSLTYTNNLPLLVANAGAKYDIPLETEMLAFPNFSLEDHWLQGKLQKLIASGRFDIVVVQQGPSSQADGREMLLTYGSKLKRLCEKNGVVLAFFMVWPPKDHVDRFDGVISNYTDAAMKTQAILCPVGLAWKACLETKESCNYYDHDGFHPSLTGSQVAAEIIVQSLFKEKAATTK